jgi:hypothetical protein
MGRLIDADAFIEYVNRRYDLCSDELRMMIEEQPTAYDVEKVVAEVQNFHLPLASQTARIANIIRKGGVE